MADVRATEGGALILAAGFGRRFGSDKRRYRLPDRRPLLEATVSRYREAFDHVMVVIRPEDDGLAAELAALPGAPRTIFASDAHLGMGHSLAAGIRAVRCEWAFAAVGLGDMPFVRVDTLTHLTRRFRAAGERAIVQPVSGDRPGHPVLFAASYFAELAGLDGDRGARDVLERHRQSIVRLAVNDPGIFQDVDRPLDP